jgi:hypothetical protein
MSIVLPDNSGARTAAQALASDIAATITNTKAAP